MSLRVAPLEILSSFSFLGFVTKCVLMKSLLQIYEDILNVYKVLSENVSVAVAENGEEVLKVCDECTLHHAFQVPLVKLMKAVKREALVLLSTWVAKAEDGKMVLESFVPPLFDAVLFDYQKNVPDAREPKVCLCDRNVSI